MRSHMNTSRFITKRVQEYTCTHIYMHAHTLSHHKHTHMHTHTHTHTPQTHTHTHTLIPDTHMHTHTPYTTHTHTIHTCMHAHTHTHLITHTLSQCCIFLCVVCFKNWSNKITASTSDRLLIFSPVYAES